MSPGMSRGLLEDLLEDRPGSPAVLIGLGDRRCRRQDIQGIERGRLDIVGVALVNLAPGISKCFSALSIGHGMLRG